MQRSALALAMMLSCVIGMWGARLPADESAPAPAVKKPPGTGRSVPRGPSSRSSVSGSLVKRWSWPFAGARRRSS